MQNFQKDYALEGLLPEYHTRTDQIVRLNREYARACPPTNLERNFSEAFRLWLFQTYLEAVNAIYEFGCGSGFNLTTLAKLYPDKNLYGLDWAASAVQLVNLIGETHGLRVKGCPFDFFSPNASLELEPNSAALTMCALEQIGDKHEEFLQFLLRKSPALCINMEPICELYDEDNLLDHLAIRYHKQRGYLEGYLSRLRQLESQGRLTILKAQRVFFGNVYHEGYSFVVWKPAG
jgi:SAM-dependent methyltransferase